MSKAPTADTAIVGEITALLERSKLAEAIAIARTALDKGLEAPLLLNLRAYWLEGEGRLEEALQDLRRARALAPADPAVANALGLCLAKLGRMEEAHTAFRDCAGLAPGFAPAHYNCGWTLEELGEFDRAAAAFEEAAKLDPRSPDPFGRLAALAARRSQWPAARGYAERARALAPNHAAATMALASADLAAKAYGSAKTHLGALIEAPNQTEQDRATAIGLLGDVLDAEGRYKEAFAAYAASNILFKGAFNRRLDARREMTMSEYAGWLLEVFENPAASSWPRTAGLPRDRAPHRHVFVLGFPRSGTTLLEEVLACHPDVVTTGEKDALAETVHELFADPPGLARLAAMPEPEISRYRAQYWAALDRLGIESENRILVDKQPFNTVRLPLIARLFPEAKIVFCLRDPRDVVLSCFRRRFTANAANAEFLSLDGAAQLYDRVMRLAAVYEEGLPLAMHPLRNEDLVADFDAQMLALCDFAGIEWSGNFREFAERSAARHVATPSAPQILRGLGRDGIGHWRKYESDLAPVLPLLSGWVERFGYDKA
jgi:Tfp pilus assembly protein PilF